MSQREKLVSRICSKGQVSIDEIKSLMSSQGFSIRQSGSHVTFTKGSESITIPARSQVKPFYLGELCDLLKRVGL